MYFKLTLTYHDLSYQESTILYQQCKGFFPHYKTWYTYKLQLYKLIQCLDGGNLQSTNILHT